MNSIRNMHVFTSIIYFGRLGNLKDVTMNLQKCPFDPFTYILIWQMSVQGAQSSALTAVQCARDV